VELATRVASVNKLAVPSRLSLYSGQQTIGLDGGCYWHSEMKSPVTSPKNRYDASSVPGSSDGTGKDYDYLPGAYATEASWVSVDDSCARRSPSTDKKLVGHRVCVVTSTRQALPQSAKLPRE